MCRSSMVLVLAGGLAVVGCASNSTPTAPSQPGAAMEPTPTPPPSQPAAPAAARYRVVFESTWSADSHPTDFPADDPHYSGLIGGTHKSSVTFWQEGAPASDGIKDMAERGRKTPLDDEVQQAITGGHAEHLLSGPELDVSPGSASMEFDVSQTFPLVTLVTMIAPSPDWFVGVSGLELFANGQWRESVRVELVGFDAGTDSGTTYRSSNRATNPREPIRPLIGYPVEAAGRVEAFGTFTFTRLP